MNFQSLHPNVRTILGALGFQSRIENETFLDDFQTLCLSFLENLQFLARIFIKNFMDKLLRLTIFEPHFVILLLSLLHFVQDEESKLFKKLCLFKQIRAELSTFISLLSSVIRVSSRLEINIKPD